MSSEANNNGSFGWVAFNTLPKDAQNGLNSIFTDSWAIANQAPMQAVENGRKWIKAGFISGAIAVITSLAQNVIPNTRFAASAASVMPYMAPVVAVTAALTFFAGLFAYKNLSITPTFNPIFVEKTLVVANPLTQNALEKANATLKTTEEALNKAVHELEQACEATVKKTEKVTAENSQLKKRIFISSPMSVVSHSFGNHKASDSNMTHKFENMFVPSEKENELEEVE